MATRSFSLNLIDVKEPCTAPWDQMAGDDISRHCEHCQLQVYDLSKLTRQQATELLATEKGICARFYRRADGTVVTSDCGNVFQRMARRVSKTTRRTGAALVSSGAAMLALLSFGLRATANASPGNSTQNEPVKVTEAVPGRSMLMGEVICIQPATQPVEKAPATQPAAPAK